MENIIGIRIKEARLNKNLKQEEVAEMIGISRVGYGKYESGVVIPNATALLKIADILGVSVDYILGRTKDKHSHKDGIDENIRMIARAKNEMTNEVDKVRMQSMLDMIKITFATEFNKKDK